MILSDLTNKTICKIVLFIFFLSTNVSCKQSRRHTAVNGSSLSGNVVKIVDGDTFDILLSDNTTRRIRMSAIDCPERRQDYYQVAKDGLSTLIFGRRVSLVVSGKDRYSRTLAEVYCDGNYVNLQMVEKGLAWHFKRYSNSTQFAQAEVVAREKRLGLWANTNPVPPWNFRKR